MDITPVYGDAVSTELLNPGTPEYEEVPILSIPNHLDVPEGWRFVRRKVTPDPTVYPDAAASREAGLLRMNSIYHNSVASAHQVCESSFSDLTKWAESIDDLGERNGEIDIIKKISMQSGVHPQWHMYGYDHSDVQVSDTFIKLCHIVANHWMKKYKSSGSPSLHLGEEELMRVDIDKVDSNCGYPTFSAEPFLRLATFRSTSFKGLPTVKDLEAEAIQWNRDLGIPDLVYPFALGRRFGPTRKPTPRYTFSGDQAVPYSLDHGLWPRIRKIYFSSAVLNKAQSSGYIQLRDAKYSVLGNYHDTHSKSLYMKDFEAKIANGWVVGESDFSGYDSTISINMIDHVIDALRKAGFNSRTLDITQWIWHSAVTLTPSWCDYGDVPNGSTAALYAGDPGLLSGIKETNNIGSFIANVLALKGLIQQNFMTMNDAISGNWLLFLDSSDDLLFCTPKELDADMYAASCAEEGIKVKYFVGRRFLQKHFYPPDEFSVAGRVVQQTLFNENLITGAGHAALALAARLSSGLTPDGNRFITEHLPRYITGDFSRIVATLHGDANSWSKQLISHPEVEQFIKSSKGQHWLYDQWLEKDFSPSAAGVISMLGIDVIDNEAAANSVAFHNLLIDAFLAPSSSKDRTEALKLMYYHIHNSGDGENALDTSFI